MNLVSCSRCGRMHPRGYKCNVGRVYKKTEIDKKRGLYAWTKKSKQIRADSLNLCAVCLDQGRYTYEGLEVHHIEKLNEKPEGLLEDDNLICLCVYHHKQADAGELTKEYLRELVAKRE